MKLSGYVAIVLFIVCFFPFSAFGQQDGLEGDKTLSPYFFVHSDEPDVDRLPLQSTKSEVDIAGVIAKVRVTQVYKNAGRRPIEATYVFPASTGAAVSGMRMTIGERVIEAKIEEREKARAQYTQAKADGKSASLLEQQRPNVFQMSVANIMPGDVIKVELDYTELLVPEDGVYEFVYPTVVGPRYSNVPRESASDRDAWVENPYLREGEPEPFSFDIGVTLNTGIPIGRMSCPSHEVNVKYDGPSSAVVSLKDNEGAGTKDFILKYSLEGEKIQSGLLLYPGGEENFFLLMMEPPARVAESAIPPREYIFVLDVSGSMSGFPLQTAKKLVRDLVEQLRESDTFNIILFSGRAAILSEKSLPAIRENVDKALDTIDRSRGGGGTELINALQTAFSLPRQDEAVSRSMVVVTDGYVSCEAEAFELIRRNLNQSNLFAFGIGSSVNRHLIEGMARCGMGEPLIVTGPNDVKTKADKFREYIQEPVLTQIKIDYEGFRTYDLEPPSVPDVLASRPVIVFGKYKGEPSGTIRVSGYSGSGEYKTRLRVGPEMAKEANEGLRYLWARHRIRTLSDYNSINMDDERVKQVTSLGLTYNLLTDYTSFVAVDSLVRNAGGDSTTVAQPLPLPQGVSDLAVGGHGVHAEAYSLGRSTESLMASPQVHNKAAGAEKRFFSSFRAKSDKAAGESGSKPATDSEVPKDQKLVQRPSSDLQAEPRKDVIAGQDTLADTDADNHGPESEPNVLAPLAKLLLAGGSIILVCIFIWRRHLQTGEKIGPSDTD